MSSHTPRKERIKKTQSGKTKRVYNNRKYKTCGRNIQ